MLEKNLRLRGDGASHLADPCSSYEALYLVHRRTGQQKRVKWDLFREMCTSVLFLKKRVK